MADKVKEMEMKTCPFCGSSDIDPEGVLCNDGTKSPQCMTCGATAESLEKWNTRTPQQSENKVFHCLECNGIDGHRKDCPEFIR